MPSYILWNLIEINSKIGGFTQTRGSRYLEIEIIRIKSIYINILEKNSHQYLLASHL